MRHARIRCDQRWSSLPRQSFLPRSLRAVSGAPAETSAGIRTHLTQGFRNRSIVPLCPVARTEASCPGGKESDFYFYLPAGVNYLFVALRFPNWNAECRCKKHTDKRALVVIHPMVMDFSHADCIYQYPSRDDTAQAPSCSDFVIAVFRFSISDGYEVAGS
jgi:hypothetical protein